MNYYDYWKKSGYIWLTDSKNDDIQTHISKQKTTKEILDEIDIAEIERYLRKKKLERINSVRKSL
jgi:hypothetical protein